MRLISQILHDPFFYVNYGSALLAIFVIHRYGEPLLRIDLYKNKREFIIRFALVTLVVGTLMYICNKAGDISLEQMGFAP